MTIISEIGAHFVGGRIPERSSILDTFDMGAFGFDEITLPSSRAESPSERFMRVYDLAAYFHTHDKGWKDEYGHDFVSLVSIFGTRNISLKDIAAFHSAGAEGKKKFITQLAEKNNAKVCQVGFQDQLVQARFGSPGFGALAVSEDSTTAYLIGPSRMSGGLEWQKFIIGYLNQPMGEDQSIDQIVTNLRETGSELFLVMPNTLV